MDDGMIVNLYWDRNEKAINKTAEKYGSYCFTISNNILKDQNDAEECVNETYLKTWNSLPPERPLSLCAFLGRIIRNLSLDRYKFNRAKKREGNEFELLLTELEECLASHIKIEHELNANLTTSLINDWLRAQQAENRVMFVRRYWDAQPIKELSDFLEVSESKVKSTLFRMRKQLKVYLEKEGIQL